jgi:Tol biopolymer transport system component
MSSEHDTRFLYNGHLTRMSLGAGSRVGPYEILSPLGAGGMGEVWRARDARLNRDVAIKILPDAFSANSDRVRRLEQEARAAAALNHPNILAVYDVGAQGGPPYIVTELLEGKTLREMLTDGALPLKKAVDYAIQIARGLAAAHGKGIVHRDLKPENLLVTADGRVKILDFGLAKLTEHVSDPRQGASVTRGPVTQPGIVLGTVGYMAPEQVRGLEADHRADVFAFGAILYEMLTGQRAFQRDTIPETMAAILKEEPPEEPVTAKPVPPMLVRILTRCLEKDPAARFHSTTDLAFALESLSSSSVIQASVGAHQPPSRHVGKWYRFGLAAAVAAALLFIGWLAARLSRGTAAEPSVVRFVVDPGALVTGIGVAHIAVSPDGSRLVFAAKTSGGSRLMLRNIDSAELRPVDGTNDATSPSWSPDGQFIAFIADGNLKKVGLAGGTPQIICRLPGALLPAVPIAPTWSPAGDIVFHQLTGLFRVPASGGNPLPLTHVDSAHGELFHVSPVFLPDGRRLLYISIGSTADLMAVSLDGTPPKLVARNLSGMMSFAQPGHLLFARGRALVAQRFDPARLQLQGDPIVIAEAVQVGPGLDGEHGPAAFSASTTGVLVYQNRLLSQTQLRLVDRQGRAVAEIAEPGTYETMALAPDEGRLAVGKVDPQTNAINLWVIDRARNTATRLTSAAAREDSPRWSPDGRRIVFNSNRDGVNILYEIPAAGGKETPLMPPAPGRPVIDDWSADGRFVLYHQAPYQELFALPMSRDRTPVAVATSSGVLDEATFSPDGRFVAYNSTESGKAEVYVVPFPATGARKWQISTSGGVQPRWRRDGRELFYLGPDGSMMAVDIELGAAVTVSTPRALFPTGITASANLDQYTVTGNGQQFILMQPVSDRAQFGLTFVVNWPSLLKR